MKGSSRRSCDYASRGIAAATVRLNEGQLPEELRHRFLAAVDGGDDASIKGSSRRSYDVIPGQSTGIRYGRLNEGQLPEELRLTH